MKPWLADPDVTLYHGDALDVLRQLPDESVHCVATSPPFYALRDYGVDGQIGLEATPDEWAARLVEVFREARRVLRADGTCWIECGDSYAGAGSGSPGPTGLAGRSQDLTRQHVAKKGAKSKDLLGTPWLLAFALRADGWWLRGCNIWCLSGGTRLYARTQKGDMPATLKDLVRLDPATVKLWNGELWTQVVAWHRAESRGEPIELELASGERIGCTPGHVWPTKRGNVRADELVAGDVIDTTRLPAPEQPDSPRFLPDAEVGWLIGRYLADGSMSGDTVQISCHRGEARDLQLRAGALATALHGSAVAHYTGGNAATVNLHGPLTAALVRGYVHGSTAKTKGLTSRVWRRSDDFLRAVLVGYLDGDGHYDEANDRWRLGFTRNDRLAADIRTLAARLGMPLRLSISTTTGLGRSWPTYRGQIRLNPERLRQREYGKVVAVRRSKGREFWDVEVEDEPHVFALASGVLTHNSKPNAMPESAKDRCTTAHSYVFQLAKSARYWFDGEAISEPADWDRWGDQTTPKHNGTETAAGWIPNKERSKLPGPGGGRRDAPQDGFVKGGGWAGGPVPLWKHPRSVWSIPTQGYPEAHFATWPEALARRIILAGCPEWVCRVCGKPAGEEFVRTPLGNGGSVDPTMHTGRKGMNRERRLDEGTRPITRADQREYARQLRGSPHRSEMSREAGPAFAHYIRTDDSGARPLPPDLLDAWLGRGWLVAANASGCGHNAYRPGVVLDPFAGSGTTCLVARKHGRRSIGIDLNEQYLELAARRLSQLSLLAEAQA